MEDNNTFYCVSVSIVRLGGYDIPVPHYYKSRERAQEHMDNYRDMVRTGRMDYRIVEDAYDRLVLRNRNWTDITLVMTECYFEDIDL